VAASVAAQHYYYYYYCYYYYYYFNSSLTSPEPGKEAVPYETVRSNAMNTLAAMAIRTCMEGRRNRAIQL